MARIVLMRGEYGELFRGQSSSDLLAEGRKLLNEAFKRGLLHEPFMKKTGKNEGLALNYDLYDVQRRPVRIIVQARHTSWSKYGNSPSKDYYFVSRRAGGRVIVEDTVAKDQVVKLARKCGRHPGDLEKALRAAEAKRVMAKLAS